MILQILFFIALAGIGGMGLGGLICTVLYKRASESFACWMLSFAAGIMTSIVCFGLMPEAIELSGMSSALTGLVSGIIIIMLLNRVVDKITETTKEKQKLHSTLEELYHGRRLINDRAKMMRSGIIMLTAIALHNIPEGLAIGVGGSHDARLGALLALLIAVHNIPEGMAVSTPLLVGGINRAKVVMLTALTGSTTLLGGIVGILIGGISDITVAIALSAAGGAMLYVVFGEMIPQAVVMTKSRSATLMVLAGVITGMLLTSF